MYMQQSHMYLYTNHTNGSSVTHWLTQVIHTRAYDSAGRWHISVSYMSTVNQWISLWHYSTYYIRVLRVVCERTRVFHTCTSLCRVESWVHTYTRVNLSSCHIYWVHISIVFSPFRSRASTTIRNKRHRERVDPWNQIQHDSACGSVASSSFGECCCGAE